jgi:hypothetical protein
MMLRVNFIKHVSYLDFLLVLFLFIIAITKAFIYFDYDLRLIDTDQAYMWQGATDFSKGLFYEPRYYGQNYNTFMEALLTAPFLILKFSVYKIMPLITIFLGVFPFLFAAFYLFLKNQKNSALIVLSVLICLPVQYDLLTSLPRGFVTGLFFCSFFIISIINPRNLNFIFLNTVLAVLGYFVNQNSVIVSIPFLIFIFLNNYNNKKYYLYSVLALLSLIPFDYFFNSFYRNHPDYVMQSTFNTFSPKYFIQSISHLNERFQHVSFFLANQCYTLIMTFIFLAIILFIKNKKAFVALCTLIILILFSFFSSKVSDGSKWVYMSYSRMFLGIPIFFILLIPIIHFKTNSKTIFLFLIPIVFACLKFNSIKQDLLKEDERKIAQGVRLLSMESCMETTSIYKNKCIENNCRFLLISSTFWLNTIVSNAGPSLHADYPETQETRFEKRYWIRNKNKERLIPEFVFLSSEFDLDKVLPPNQKFTLKRLDDYGLFLVQNNELKIGDFIDNINRIEPGLND